MASDAKNSSTWSHFIGGAALGIVCATIYHFAGIEKLPLVTSLLMMLGIGAVLGLIMGAVLKVVQRGRS
jgi:hypothetical protein